jgi:23S rRNA pseudouridine2605 synthase
VKRADRPRRGPRRGQPKGPPKGLRRGALAAAEPERLQKLLARAGLASRREAEEWIRAGRITVNGQTATLGVRAGPADDVRLDGRVVRQRAAASAYPSVFICHRSPGENLTQPAEEVGDETAQPHLSPALLDRLPRRAGRRFITVSPMPRIDGGLELVTSDGELAARLQRGVRHLTSEFSVRIKGELNDQQIASILHGELDRGDALAVEHCEPAGGEAANRWYSMAARGASGKEVRQLFERQGALVSRVLRTKLGPLTLERTLARGRFRALAPEELQALIRTPDS